MTFRSPTSRRQSQHIKQPHIYADTSVAQIEVINHDEVRLYGDRGPGPYVIMRRVHGKWRYYNTGGIFTS
jgi:hypothetical protein